MNPSRNKARYSFTVLGEQCRFMQAARPFNEVGQATSGFRDAHYAFHARKLVGPRSETSPVAPVPFLLRQIHRLLNSKLVIGPPG
jgi:hypothetical protein